MSYKGNLNSAEPVHQYLDINIVNNDTQGDKPPVRLVFNEIRNNPIILNPSEYFFSIVRFSLETVSLPLMIPQVMLGQIDPNKLIYSITMTYNSPVNGITYEKQTFIRYVPQSSNQPVPSPPLVRQDFDPNGDYYYIYNFQYWIKLVNTTLADCLSDLNTIVLGATGAPLPSLNAPFMEWDTFNNVAILNADIAGFNQSNAHPVNIFFNTPLFTLFSSFQADYKGFQNITNGKNYLITISDSNGTNSLILPTYTALQMYQDYSTSALWNPVNALVFTTGTIPVNPSQVSAPIVFNSDVASLSLGGNNANISNTLTDFEVPLTDGFESKPNVFYTPTAEFRLVDLLGNTPLNNISIQVFWKDAFANLHPFFLNSGCNANIKILFRRKDFNLKGF
jgi:hypothetical protein